MQREPDGPWFRENLRIIDGRFILNRIGAGHAVSLNHVGLPRHNAVL
jgi:hypothetical protein